MLMEGNGYGEEGPFDTANWTFSPLGIWGFYLIWENVLGIDNLTKSNSIGEFYLQFGIIKPVLRGNANWEPVTKSLPEEW